MSELKTGGKVIDGTSMAASFTSDPVDVSNASLVGIQAVAASDTHVGTVRFEVSNTGASGEWITVASATVSNGTALLHFQNIIDCTAKYLQIRYEATSGAGNLYVTVTKKGRA